MSGGPGSVVVVVVLVLVLVLVLCNTYSIRGLKDWVTDGLATNLPFLPKQESSQGLWVVNSIPGILWPLFLL